MPTRPHRIIPDALRMLRLKLNYFKRTTPYQGPLFDAMMQINSQVSESSLLETMERAGVYRMCLFAREQNPYPATQHCLEIALNNPTKFVLGAPKRFNSRDDISDEFLEYLTALTQQPEYQFIGELQCTHADKYPYSIGNEHTLRGERYIQADAPNMMQLARNLAGTGKPIYLHWEAYAWARDWPHYDNLFKSNPTTIFVWPHAGYADAVYVNEVMNRHDNVYATISKRDMYYFDHKWRTYRGDDVGSYGLNNREWQDNLGSAMLELNGDIKDEWYYLLERFPTRFLFGIDAHKMVRWHFYTAAVENFRMILGQLPQALADQIAYKNAEQLFGSSQSKTAK